MKYKASEGTIEVKRLYLPITIKTNCHSCNHENEINLETDYLSYPALGQEEEIYYCCEECLEDNKLLATLQITLTTDNISIPQ